MNITWKPTVIAGDAIRADFCAEVESIPIGRVTKIVGGPQNNQWQWNFQLGHSEFRYTEVGGVESQKQAAADKIKAALARFMEYPADKGGGLGLSPEQWRPGENAYAKAKGG
jgi:hypothetical protein